MKIAKIITILVIASLFLCLGARLVMPAIHHPAPVLAAETPSDQPPIQSLRPEGTVPSVRSEVDALPSSIPNDSYFPKQWALQKMQGWQTTSGGSQVLVAVLDTGIDAQHEDLAGKVVGSVNFTKSATASDVLGHGTHIAGIITATANNGIGVAGFAPNARLLNVKIADDNGMVWASTIAEGIIWAVDNGARIINMSLVVPTSYPALEEAVNYASGKGVVLIAAAGNNIKSIPVYPAYYPNVIAVSATDSDGRLWAESNNGDWVDVYAPGVEIFSTNPGNSYGYLSGTSMATAYATAAAALMFDTVTDVNGDGSVSDEVSVQLKAFFGDLE